MCVCVCVCVLGVGGGGGVWVECVQGIQYNVYIILGVLCIDIC